MGCSIYRLPEKAYQQKRLLWCLKGCDNLSFLNERRQKKDRLSDVLQWHHLLTSNIILLKDGSLMSVIQYRGPDLDSSTDIELMNVMGRINNVLRHFSGEWVVNFESQRNKTVTCPKRHFPDPVCQMIDDERRALFNSGDYYESNYFMTFNYLPPPDTHIKILDLFLTRTEVSVKDLSKNYKKHLANFKDQLSVAVKILHTTFASIELLQDSELLTYLHSCISLYPHLKIASPRTYNCCPLYIDEILSDTPITGGYEPKLGNKYLRVIGIKAFPASTMPGYLDSLNRLNIDYRWCSRYIALDKQTALEELEKYRKTFFSGRSTAGSYLRQIASEGRDSGLEDRGAAIKQDDCELNIDCIANDDASEGYFTLCVVLTDNDQDALEMKVKQVVKTIHSLGFIAFDENLNCLEAWLGSLPGHPAYNVRHPLYYSLGLTHLLPLSAVWAGKSWNQHLNNYPLIYAHTSGNTPFRLDLHYGDVGHTMMIGPTGAGKSTHLALIAAQFRSYPDAQIYIFDKDASSRVLTYGVGGEFYDLGSEDSSLSFQPLARINIEAELIWAHEWLCDILDAEGITLTADIKNTIFSALTSLSSAPVRQRTMTGLLINLQDIRLRETFSQFTVKGMYGTILDADNDSLAYGNWQSFEMGRLMKIKAVCPHVLSYLFHRLETDRLNGAPTLFVLDECWLFFKSKNFTAKIDDWLRTLRKKNAFIVFASQSIEEIENSPILPAIRQACYSKIFLPNPNASNPKVAKIYHAFGLNETETDILSRAQAKQEYYFKNPSGSRLYSLALQETGLAWTGSSTSEDQKTALKIFTKQGAANFAKAWLASKGLTDAVKKYF